MLHPYSKSTVMQMLQLSIPEPCHENWHYMTPTEQGRFCNACTKEVVDFSMMTDTEVINYFSTLTHEKVCGRALPTQLNRTISWPKEPRKRWFWYWNYVVMFLMFFSKSNTVKAQGGIKPVTEISKALACKVGETVKNDIRVVTGKVIDAEGNPVSFATIKIKGASAGLSADADGVYSIKVKSNNLLVISGASFKEAEEPVGQRLYINTILQKSPRQFLGDVSLVVINGCYEDQKQVALLKVKDDETELPVAKAKIIIAAGSYSQDIDTALTDKKGSYKLKGIKRYEHYHIKIVADGYEVNEFSISNEDFNDRKKVWEVLLRKQKIRLGGISVITEGKGPVYVVDGTIMTNDPHISFGEVDVYKILLPAEAAALLGNDGSNGAVWITTRKAKVKNLDTVLVTAVRPGKVKAETVCTSTVIGSMIKGVTIKSTITDSLKWIATKFNGTIRTYPNPVQRGNSFNVSLKLKQAGVYHFQITDVSGKIVLITQTNIPFREYVEKIPADRGWTSGVYYISLFDNKNQFIHKTCFVVQ